MKMHLRKWSDSSKKKSRTDVQIPASDIYHAMLDFLYNKERFNLSTARPLTVKQWIIVIWQLSSMAKQNLKQMLDACMDVVIT